MMKTRYTKFWLFIQRVKVRPQMIVMGVVACLFAAADVILVNGFFESSSYLFPSVLFGILFAGLVKGNTIRLVILQKRLLSVNAEGEKKKCRILKSRIILAAATALIVLAAVTLIGAGIVLYRKGAGAYTARVSVMIRDIFLLVFPWFTTGSLYAFLMIEAADAQIRI